jgi:hypothetical protein
MSPCTPPTESQVEVPDDRTEHLADAGLLPVAGEAETEERADGGSEATFPVEFADPYQDLGGGD